MTYKYYFESSALKEYLKAVKWYKKRSHLAAVNFVNEMNSAIDIICRQPTRFRKRHQDFRETALKKYPFFIIYTFDENKKQVIIFSIYHFKKNPLKKYRKR